MRPSSHFIKNFGVGAETVNRPTDWATLSMQAGVELINCQMSSLADLLDSKSVDGPRYFAEMLAHAVERCHDNAALQMILQILQEKMGNLSMGAPS